MFSCPCFLSLSLSFLFGWLCLVELYSFNFLQCRLLVLPANFSCYGERAEWDKADRKHWEQHPYSEQYIEELIRRICHVFLIACTRWIHDLSPVFLSKMLALVLSSPFLHVLRIVASRKGRNNRPNEQIPCHSFRKSP